MTDGSLAHDSSKDKQETLKGIIRDLHKGESMDVLKRRFAELVKAVSPSEIAELEQKLIEEGMPEDEVKRLCDVHVEVFKESLEEQPTPQASPGHPVNTFMRENRASERIMADIISLLDKIGDTPDTKISQDNKVSLRDLVDKLSELDIHYLRNENQLFPLLESHNVSGPSQVMWAIHDDIRALFRRARDGLSGDRMSSATPIIRELLQIIRDMIYKEEHILYPMSLEALSESDWRKVREGEEEIGYAWIEPGQEWAPETEVRKQPIGEGESPVTEHLSLDMGHLSLEQINLMLNHLPVDISFVNENDEVVYYSRGDERIFSRSPAVIGRKVQKCHPSKSVHVVQKILDEFKSGGRDTAAFWIELNGRFIYIRYFAVRDAQGSYKGTLEVSQDVTEIRGLEGENRLLDWV